LEKIGEGSSGVVYRCSKRKTGEIFAAKSFKFEDEHVPNLKANFILQKSLNHPSIIRYEAIYLNMKKYLGWLVMEYI
jgi:serine/threonine protein kinase